MKIRSALVLVLVAALFLCGCSAPALPSLPSGQSSVASVAEEKFPASAEASPKSNDKAFTLVVIDADGAEEQFALSSEAGTLYDALSRQGLIDGYQSAAGFVVTCVNGLGADYASCGIAWELLLNGKVAPLPCDRLDIEDGAVYTFIAQ